MRLFQIGTFLAGLTALVIGFQNCAKQGVLASNNDSSADAVAMRKSMASLKSQLLGLSAKNLGCATDQDCAMVPVGSLHCGAPTFTVLSSSASPTFAEVLSLARAYGDLEKSYAAANQWVGTCVSLDPPQPRCLANVCTTD